MEEFLISIMNQFGYLGVFFLIFIENVFPPIPSEVILLFGGFMTTYSKLNILIMTMAATIGSVAGAIVLYYIGKILNKERLKKIRDTQYDILKNLEESSFILLEANYDPEVLKCSSYPFSLKSRIAGPSRSSI